MSDTNTGAPAPSSEASTAPVDANSPEVSAEEDTGADLPPELEVKPGDTKKEVQAKREAKRMYQLQINGKAKDIEIDTDNDDEMRKYLQKAMAADEKFQEAAMTRKQAEQLVDMLRTNPMAILKHPELGLDIKQLATQILNEELEEMAKTPEQKKLEEMEQKLKSYEEEKKKLEEGKRQADMERIQAEAYQQLDDDITEALGRSDLPKSPYVIKRISDAMIEAVQLGYVDVRVQDIMPYVEQQITEEIQAMFQAKPADVMEKVIGKKNLDNYRKSKITKKAATPKAVETAASIKDTGGKEKKSEAPQKDSKKRFKDVFGNF